MRLPLPTRAVLSVCLSCFCGACSESGAGATVDLSAASDAGLHGDAGCTQHPAPPPLPAPPWRICTGAVPAAATAVKVFDKADHHAEPEDRRTIEAEVDLPTGRWQRIDARVELSCPADGDCDNWDRFANISLVENRGAADETELELARYITPYDMGFCFTVDVTRFQEQLSGEKVIRSFIDTWVGPNETQHGHGWRVSLTLVFHPTCDAPEPPTLVPLFPYASIEVGNPDNTVKSQLAVQQVSIPSDIKRAEAWVVVTGHGQGNLGNCAEFCHLHQALVVNGSILSFDPWRDDCATNPTSPQAGTWNNARAGWCPGAVVSPKVLDVLGKLKPGQANSFEYRVLTPQSTEYVNTCRPGAGGATNRCTGCAFDPAAGNCDYNGGMHTKPNDRVSVQLALYR